MKADFKEAAAAEIAAFKAEYRRRNPGADVEKITDEELLREVMNTVGKRGKLGEQVRCVVSVSMLTEGWDANTVTHILGVRAFGSQLLCEQVVGRGLRRRNYAVNEDGHFEPEYANVYGIPFQFISSDKPVKDPLPPQPVQQVAAVEGREDLRITFPKLTGYRVELPDDEICLDLRTRRTSRSGRTPCHAGSSWKASSASGSARTATRRRTGPGGRLRPRQADPRQQFNTVDDKRPWLFPRLVDMCRWWIEQKVVVADGYSLGLPDDDHRGPGAGRRDRSGTRSRSQVGNRRERLRPMINRFNPIELDRRRRLRYAQGRRAARSPRSPMSPSTARTATPGNSSSPRSSSMNSNVAAFVKNDHLGFTSPTSTRAARTTTSRTSWSGSAAPGEDFDRTLIVEVSGSQKSPGPTQAKANTARNSWCVAVNNHGGFGRWGYVEMTDPLAVQADAGRRDPGPLRRPADHRRPRPARPRLQERTWRLRRPRRTDAGRRDQRTPTSGPTSRPPTPRSSSPPRSRTSARFATPATRA